MPVKWTEAADRNLLLVVVKSCNLNYAQIAEAYRKQYGTDTLMLIGPFPILSCR